MKTPLNKLETIALSVTRSIGSIGSVIIHTIIFIVAFSLIFFGISIDRVLLVLTTILSLEAIYLSIFIQMSVNYQGRALASVEKEIDGIAEDVEDIQENVEEMQEDVEGIAEDVEEIQEDMEDIAEDVEDIQENIDEMQDEIDVVDEKIDNNRPL